jgi:hypothetical protein
MKKTIVAAIVGGIIIFIWQFLSFALINFHKPAQNYTVKQDAIMNFLNSQQLPEGGYFLPNIPDNSTSAQRDLAMKEAEGKPWAIVQYHHTLKNNMVMNMVRGFLVDIIILLLFCWLLKKMGAPRFNTIVVGALVVGLIVFLNAPYTNAIWYENFDTWAHLADAIVSWGLVGLWLAWWFGRSARDKIVNNTREPSLEMTAD